MVWQTLMLEVSCEYLVTAHPLFGHGGDVHGGLPRARSPAFRATFRDMSPKDIICAILEVEYHVRRLGREVRTSPFFYFLDHIISEHI